MANIGMKYPVFAKVASETPGSAVTYTGGQVMAHAIAATITQNRRDNPLYADDIKVENDKGLTDYTIALEIDNLSNEVRAALLGEVKTSDEYAVTEDSAPYVGFGYMTVKMVNNVVNVEAYWFYKVQFGLDSEEATTKREQIEWGTPNLTGTGLGVVIDASGKAVHYVHSNFATEAAAKSLAERQGGHQLIPRAVGNCRPVSFFMEEKKMQKITIGSTELPLLFNANAFGDIEENVCMIQELNEKMNGRERIRTLCKVIAILANNALRKEGKKDDITHEWILDNMHPRRFPELQIAVMEAIGEGMYMETENTKEERDLVLEEIEKKAQRKADIQGCG